MKKVNLALVAAILLAVAFGPFIVVAFAASGDAWTAGWDHTNNVDEVRVDETGDLIPGVTNSNSLGTSALKWSAVEVTAGGLSDSSVIAADILAGAVTTTKLNNDAVITSKILNDAITTAKISEDAVISSKILSAAVTTAKINDDAVTTSKIANGAVTTAKIEFSAAGFTFGEILCVTTQKRIGVCKSAFGGTTCNCQ